MIQTYLISLEAAKTRRRIAEDALKTAGLAFTRVEAVDGRNWPAKAVPGFGRPVVGAEQGCLASHLTALTAFLDGDMPLGLVLEDDVDFVDAPGLRAVADWLLDRPAWDVVHLSDAGFGFRSPWGAAGGLCVDRAHLFPMTTPALLWSRQGAGAFLESKPNWPMDHALRRWTLARRSGLGLDRALVRLAETESLIEGRDAVLDARYMAKRRVRRRREKAHAAWNRMLWQMIGR